jgi:hypothetical protein
MRGRPRRRCGQSVGKRDWNSRRRRSEGNCCSNNLDSRGGCRCARVRRRERVFRGHRNRRRRRRRLAGSSRRRARFGRTGGGRGGRSCRRSGRSLRSWAQETSRTEFSANARLGQARGRSRSGAVALHASETKVMCFALCFSEGRSRSCPRSGIYVCQCRDGRFTRWGRLSFSRKFSASTDGSF